MSVSVVGVGVSVTLVVVVMDDVGLSLLMVALGVMVGVTPITVN